MLFLYIGDVSNSKIPTVIALIVLILFSGLRYEVGLDFIPYWTIFKEPEWSSVELGYKWICEKNLALGFGPQTIYLLSSIVTITLIHKSLQYYCNTWAISFVYFCFLLGGWFLESFNIVRQYVAISIFFYATRYIISKEILKYIGLIILGSFFHMSVLLTIPFYFILDKYYSKTAITVLLVFTLLISNFISITSLSFIPLYGERYLVEHTEYAGSAELGLGFATKLLLVVLVVFFFRDKLLQINTKYNVVINACVYYCVLMILFKDIIVFLRGAYYFHIFFVIILQGIQLCFHKDSRFIVNITIALYVIILFSVQMLDKTGLLIPYRMNTNLYLM